MKKLFDIANAYLKTCDWKHFTLIKLCLISLGLVVGLLIPAGAKNAVLTVSVVVFLAAYISVMIRFVHFLRKAWRG